MANNRKQLKSLISQLNLVVYKLEVQEKNKKQVTRMTIRLEEKIRKLRKRIDLVKEVKGKSGNPGKSMNIFYKKDC